jgi:hypothetical protein
MNGNFTKKLAKIAGVGFACIALVYILIYVDVVLRARSAYLEGEKYWSWYQDPKLKDAAVQNWYLSEKGKLDIKLSKNTVTKDEYDRQLELLDFTKNQKLRESSIKYAYVWYQTVVELFSPPESKWVKLAREKMPKAKELWKKELTDKKIPFEEYMLD